MDPAKKKALQKLMAAGVAEDAVGGFPFSGSDSGPSGGSDLPPASVPPRQPRPTFKKSLEELAAEAPSVSMTPGAPTPGTREPGVDAAMGQAQIVKRYLKPTEPIKMKPPPADTSKGIQLSIGPAERVKPQLGVDSEGLPDQEAFFRALDELIQKSRR